ncbi:MAG: hypothetical protein AAGP08_05550, partial [Pseudomonadota bacterium]
DFLQVENSGFEESVIEGGAGEDTIATDITDQPSLLGNTQAANTASGGDGADTFDITVYAEQTYDTSTLGGADPIDIGDVFAISDFTPGEDVVVIRTAVSGSTGTEFIGFDLVEEADGTQVNLLFNYPGADATQTQMSLRLEGATGVTASDIIIQDTPRP